MARQKNTAKATDFLNRAEALMQKNGCRRKQDRFNETRRLPAASPPDAAVVSSQNKYRK